MASISLPMVDANLTLDDAFSEMKRTRRSGVVWKKSESEFVLIQASDLVIAKSNRRAIKLSEVFGEKVLIPNIEAIAHETPSPFIELKSLSVSLKATASNYGLLAAGTAAGETRALVFSSSLEYILKLEAGPSDCYCKKCRNPVPKGQRCQLDDFKPICKD